VKLEVLVPDCESAYVYQTRGPPAGTPDSPAAGPRADFDGDIADVVQARSACSSSAGYGNRTTRSTAADRGPTRRFDVIEQTHCCRYPLTDRRKRAPVRASSGRRR
jgi:hypothetical protein